MTERRDFDRLARAWLDLMPNEAPDRTIGAVLQAIELTPQLRRPLVALRRPFQMNRFSYAALAAVLVVAIGGGAYLLSSRAPSIGAPTPSPGASTQASAVPSPTLALSPAARQLWGDWVADAQLGLRDQGPRIQLSINWDGGKDAWLQTGFTNGAQIWDSDVVAAPDGELRLVARATADGCQKDDVGTYRWSRPGDGEFMTLTAISDQCATRATTLSRAWVYAVNAVNDGGHGVLPVDNLELTLPHRKFGLNYVANGPHDSTFDSTPYIEFLGIKNPTPFAVPCASQAVPGTPLAKTADIVSYVKSIPAFTYQTATATIDGHPAIHLTGTPIAGYQCKSGDTGFFYGNPDNNGADTSWTISNGNTQALSIWITQVGNDAYLFWYRGDQVTPADEAVVIQSIHFITQLPAPTP